MTLAVGTRLGPYEVVAQIGAGGMGEVYRPRDPKLGRDVALKVLPDAFARDAQQFGGSRAGANHRRAELVERIEAPRACGTR